LTKRKTYGCCSRKDCGKKMKKNLTVQVSDTTMLKKAWAVGKQKKTVDLQQSWFTIKK
jgi:hypothetical protein